MITPGSTNPLLLRSAAAVGYSIPRSLRFNSADSAYLSRTPASAGTSYTTWTWSQWVKRAALGSSQALFSAGVNTNDYLILNFEPNDTLRLVTGENGTTNLNLFATTAVFRDPSAWYHIVLQSDTTNATQADRWKIYVNGIRQAVSGTIAAQNYAGTTFNRSGVAHNIARQGNVASYFNGYLADIHFIDGQALDPTSFGETDTNGIWQPKAYTGSYGTNGFRLPFSDNSAATATTLGKDSAGSNNWTPNNVSTNTGGPTSVASASGALPLYNTTDTYGTTKGTGTRTDGNSSSIVLAVAMDGSNNGTTFTDESATIKGSGSAKTITRNGAITSTSQSKYYGSSGSFDGTDDYLLASTSADFQFGSGDFTIETWFYPNTNARMALYHGSYGTDWSIGIDFSNITQTIAIWASSNGTTWNLANGDSSGARGTQVLATGKWHHVAMVRNGSNLDLYVNGILDKRWSGISGSIVDRSSSQPSIGTWFGGQYDLNGYLQDFRVYKGVAKYTSNFNPPSSTVIGTVAAANDSLVDSPTNGTASSGGDAGGVVVGNYATLNPLQKGTNVALVNGNLDWSKSGGNAENAYSTIALTSGKWYWESTINSVSAYYPGIGVETNPSPDPNAQTGQYNALGYMYFANGQKYNNGTLSAYGASYTANDVIGVALNLDAGTLTFYKNGSSQGQAFSGLASFAYSAVTGNGGSCSFNFGQRPFAYAAPSGFKSLNTANLPTPTILKGSSYFDIKLYTGNGSTQTISGLGFSPDFTWFKARSAAYGNALHDVVRGSTSQLVSNLTVAESTVAQSVASFNSDGFTIGSNNGYNENNTTYAAWCWDAGSSTVTNTAGSISAQVRANASAGFSVVTYTGTGSLLTVGHGLNAKPEFYVIKRRDVSSEWTAYHSALGATKYITLQSTAAAVTTINAWNNTEPTSTVLTVSNAYGDLNANGGSYVIYAWAPVAGYSAFGSYTGNGSADGPFVYTGFRPRWVMIKSTGSSAWTLQDTARSTYNLVDARIFPNTSEAELSNGNGGCDYLSNGFKVRVSHSEINTNAATYIYAAFAENPFSIARAR